MLRIFFHLLLFLLLYACGTQQEPSVNLNGEEILANSKLHHDPNGQWENTAYAIHIQEPRVQNPSRFSRVWMSGGAGGNSFTLERNRDHYVAKYVIDPAGTAKVYLDDSETIADSLVAKYRLDPARNEGYRGFYQLLYGLPMSLNDDTIDSIGQVKMTDYHKESCYAIDIVLKEAMFSKYWRIYLSTTTYAYQGMEIYFPEDPEKGERLYFGGQVKIGDLTIPRIRHWHELSTDEYSGSDIITGILETE